MRLTVLTAADLRAALPMADAIEAMKDAFADFSAGRVEVPARMTLHGEHDGVCLVKPAGRLSTRNAALGAKLVSVFPSNPTLGKPLIYGLVVMIDPATGEPNALLEGGFLTAWRTGAASGAATDLLALESARQGAVLGAGVQAHTQILAIDSVRELESIRVAARDHSKTRAFVDRLQPDVEARLVAAKSIEEAVAGAQIVCTATTSPTPVLRGRDVEPGCHVNAVGAFTPRDPRGRH